ncbi:MAG: carboxymuconolactone decarboxylase family protein [Chloroflexi bacterium]|nr:carboxymuconolactone decarboxylase family protein [Chloroflexota bacterium]
MSHEIHMAAIITRDGKLLMLRSAGAGQWEMPGGVLAPGEDDIDEAMDAVLAQHGLRAPAIEEDFLQTVYLPRAGGQAVLNLYAPTEWTGDVRAPEGREPGWFALSELETIEMDGAVRHALLQTFGLGDEDEDELLLTLAAAMEPEFDEPSLPPDFAFEARPAAAPPAGDRRAAGMDVLRTLSGGADPDASIERLQRTSPELAADIVDFALGEVWSHPALDRRTRSLEVVAMLAAMGGKHGPLRSHINGALNHGASPEQVIQTLRMVAVYAGFPAALDAWAIMEEVFAAREIVRPGQAL